MSRQQLDEIEAVAKARLPGCKVEFIPGEMGFPTQMMLTLANDARVSMYGRTVQHSFYERRDAMRILAATAGLVLSNREDMLRWLRSEQGARWGGVDEVSAQVEWWAATRAELEKEASK